MTDDERRRVAKRLRWLVEVGMPPWAGYTYKTVVGYMPLVFLDFAYYESSYRDYCLRLADLIDPDTTFDAAEPDEDTTSHDRDMLYVTYSRSTCGPDGRAYMVKVRHRTRGWERDFYAVDRESLLRLSEGLEKDADRIMDAARAAKIAGQGPRMEAAKLDAYEWRSIARQIRRACGEENE